MRLKSSRSQSSRSSSVSCNDAHQCMPNTCSLPRSPARGREEPKCGFFHESTSCMGRRQFLQKLAVVTTSGLVLEMPTDARGRGLRQVKRSSSWVVPFGKTDLKVSRLCQGTAFRKNKREADDPNAQRVLRACLDSGINFFDSSNAYGWGGSELALGRALAGRRSEVVICTKVHPGLKPVGSNPAQRVPFTRAFAQSELEGSLRRLRTDYVDLYLLHNPDELTPLAEIFETMQALVQSGKVRYWGVSNHSPEQVARFVELGKQGGHAIAGIQNYYNLIQRELEGKMFPLLRENKLGLMPYSPLDEGRLLEPLSAVSDAGRRALLSSVDEAARQCSATRAQVLIAWVLSHPEATCALAGAETPEHIKENLGALDLVLPPEVLSRLNAASNEYLQQRSKQAGKSG